MAPARTLAADLVKMLAESETPLYVLDEERTILFCNEACAKLFALSPEALMGQVCAFHSSPELENATRVAALLCPPPTVFSGQKEQALIAGTLSDGASVARKAHFFPLSAGEDESAAVLVVLDTASATESDSGQTTADLHRQLQLVRERMARRYSGQSLLGEHSSIVRARAQIDLAAGSLASVLVVGPRGTGKNHVVRAIHYSQAEPGGLVPIDCGVLETNAVRSTLRGQWSRASISKEPTTSVLLVDVEALAAEARQDLLEILRADSTRLRWLTTTSERAVPFESTGPQDAELVCRLSTVTIELVPLSGRIDDLPLVAQAMLEEVNAQGTRQVGGFSAEALDRLMAYHWPGNFDELEAMVREAHQRASGGQVRETDLPYRIEAAADAKAHPRKAEETIVLEEFLARVERELIERAMRQAKGNKTKAARLLGLSRPRLYRRLVQLGLERLSDSAAD